jgi:periodic tryptophan protein 2
VKDVKFSPDGKCVFRQKRFLRTKLIEHRFIAVTHGAHVQVWKTPNHLAREFAPFELHREYTGHHDDVLSVTWSADSKCVAPASLQDIISDPPCRCFISTSRDMTARLFTLHPVSGFRPKTFAGHRDAILGAYFSENGTEVG